MQFSLRTKIILIGLLVILNLIFRFPTTPHEIGLDSFSVHVMANSISDFGYAKWWLHPTSITGSYPFSTSPSAVPFLLSGISLGTNIDMELTILLYSMILGILGIFAAYLMAGAIWNNDAFKILVAFAFSTSLGILTKTTWAGNARTLFILALPLFIYLLLRTRTSKMRFSILTFIVLVLLLVTHHFIYYTIPLVISYLTLTMIYISGKHIKSIRIPENIANCVVFSVFLILFSVGYFNRSLWWGDPELMRSAHAGSSSIYVWIVDIMLKSYVRYVGILIVFVIGGYTYLLLKRNKKFEEWFLLLCLACLAPLLYMATYMKWFILPFTALLIGIALTNVSAAKTSTNKKKYGTTFIIILLVSATIFTGYYQYLHFLDDSSGYSRYMEERTYVGGLWIKDNIAKEEKMIVGNPYITQRVFSTSKVPTLTGVDAADLAYGFVDPDELEVKKVHNYTSVNYYLHDPYVAVNQRPTSWWAYNILLYDINDKIGLTYRLISKFNFSYYVEDEAFSNELSQSVQQIKDCLYDNGKIRVWDLELGG